MQATRLLYIACVASIADYSTQAWWGKGKKGPLKYFQTLQNAALRQILGAFKGSPIRAMEIEAAILPPQLRAEKLCKQYALRIQSFSSSHPIRRALLWQKQNSKGLHTQLQKLASTAEYSNVEEISTLLAKPWSKPVTAYATIAISTQSKEIAAR